ncbi:class I SAM-dependent methyltransferase [Streptomyces sp. NBC_00286]|nr:class I SAM-dependent methyltransferase [Streptomyces sp. NBC_00286]
MSTETADRWIHSWDAQQEHYAIGREERFTVIADVVAHAGQGAANPLVADLGCGPGSLAARLAVTHPHWEVVGVDADPLLLALGRASYGSTIRLVETVIGTDGWIEALELSRPLDAVVSSTALHYLPEKSLLEVYGQLHQLLRPGGVLVNADHFLPEDAALSALTGEVGRRAAERRGVPGRSACRAAPTGPLGGERPNRPRNWRSCRPKDKRACRPGARTTRNCQDLWMRSGCLLAGEGT